MKTYILMFLLLISISVTHYFYTKSEDLEARIYGPSIFECEESDFDCKYNNLLKFDLKYWIDIDDIALEYINMDEYLLEKFHETKNNRVLIMLSFILKNDFLESLYVSILENTPENVYNIALSIEELWKIGKYQEYKSLIDKFQDSHSKVIFDAYQAVNKNTN